MGDFNKNGIWKPYIYGLRDSDDYGKGGFDPLGDKYSHKIEHCTYYDEKGNVISNR